MIRNRYPLLLERALDIYNGISAHPELFAAPNPPLPVLQQAIQDFAAAQQATHTRARGTVQARDLKARALLTLLETEQSYVQALVDGNPEQGSFLITAAGMLISQPRTYAKPLLQATQDAAGSPVHLSANVGALSADIVGRFFFNWQLSQDGGNTWRSVPSTPHGQTDIAGLTPLVAYAFRVSITDKLGTGEWSQAVTLLVH
ncbi:MAG: fibronectin type III domain-containing protein [Minicystis sp.]